MLVTDYYYHISVGMGLGCAAGDVKRMFSVVDGVPKLIVRYGGLAGTRGYGGISRENQSRDGWVARPQVMEVG